MLVNILIFIAVLGVLIFFHELGHFLAAKACGIYVDRFSLGMPPRVFGVRLGETDYCIGALPIGGYVKMAGQEDAPLTDEERDETYGHVPEDRWFNNKPVWQRFIVIFAGPAMNFVLAILLYGVIAAVGAQVPETDVDNRIGMIQPDAPAATAPMYLMTDDRAPVDLEGPPYAVGWQTGDRLLSIDGERIINIKEDAAYDAVLGAGKTLRVVIERSTADGTARRYLSPIKPQVLSEDGLARFGIAPFETVLIAEVLPDSPAQASGLLAEDIIRRANDRVVDQLTFRDLVEKTPEGETIALEVQREEGNVDIVVQPETVGRCLGLVAGTRLPSPPRSVRSPRSVRAPPPPPAPVVLVAPENLAEARDLLPGDIIETMAGQPATLDLLSEIERLRPGEQVEVGIRRPEVLFGLLREEESRTAVLTFTAVRAIGVRFGVSTVFHRVPAALVVPEAFRRAYQAMTRTMRTIKALATRSVSPKNIGGPVMIFQITTWAAREGVWRLFHITAFVSANLCVFNLLPIPVLDGGLLIYLLIEAVRRKPLDIKVLERIQQVGLVLIISLLVFVTYNDISRWVMSKLP